MKRRGRGEIPADCGKMNTEGKARPAPPGALADRLLSEPVKGVAVGTR